jgi:hypothetical protein
MAFMNELNFAVLGVVEKWKPQRSGGGFLEYISNPCAPV